MQKPYKPLFWLEEISPPKKAGIPLLASHGLNQRPEALHPLLKALEEIGNFKAHLLHLPGHQNREEDAWVKAQDYHMAIQVSLKEMQSRYGQVEHFMGYSFGGLVGLLPQESFPFKKVLLLAPALKLRVYTHLLRPVLPLLSRVESLSLGGEDLEARYRCHQQGVPAAVYKSFFQLYSEFQQSNKEHLNKTQGLVLVHPKDELISYSALKKWVTQQTSWGFRSLENRQATLRRYNHLCFDELTLGEAGFKDLVTQAQEFLSP